MNAADDTGADAGADRGGELVAGRFELYDRIGRGGVGSVYRAYDRKHDDMVAAKLLTHPDAAMVLRFVREQSLRIAHPHVVAPSGWAADDERVVLRMDLVRGGSVATLLGDHGALPASYVAVLLDQVLDALTAIHAIGVVHRDLKPANLLLEVTGTGRPWVRVSDFGIAAVVDEPRLTQPASSIGTLGYMAPEQAAGQEPDPRQDLYAVGVIGRVLLTGLPPRSLPGLDHEPDAAGTVSGRPAGGSPPLWSWLLRLSATDPAARPGSAGAARTELAALGVPDDAPWADGPDAPEVFDQLGPDPARGGGPVTEAAPPQRRRLLLGVAVGSLLGAVLLLVIALTVLLG